MATLIKGDICYQRETCLQTASCLILKKHTSDATNMYILPSARYMLIPKYSVSVKHNAAENCLHVVFISSKVLCQQARELLLHGLYMIWCIGVQGAEMMMMMKSGFWWRNPEYPEETTDLRQATDETFHTYGLCPVRGLNLGHSGVKQSKRNESGALAHRATAARLDMTISAKELCLEA